MDIGKPKRTIVIEPVEEPIPGKEVAPPPPEPVYEPEPAPAEKEPVPA